jgi:hypothetical protein
MWLALGVAYSIALFWLCLARADEAVRRDWQRLLTPGDHPPRHPHERRIRFEMAMAEITCPRSYAELEFASLHDAQRLLHAGHEVIANFAPSLSSLPGAMARFSRVIRSVPFSPSVRGASARFRIHILVRSVALVVRCLGDPSRPLLRPEAHDELCEMFRGIFGEPSTHVLWQLAERREQWRHPRTPGLAFWTALLAVGLVASGLLSQL